MRLRYQLMTVAALAMALPVFVWFGVKGIDQAVRETSNDRLNVMSRAARQYVETMSQTDGIADYFRVSGMTDSFNDNRWVATPVAYPIALDGYDDEWVHSRLQDQFLSAQTQSVSSADVSVRMAIRGDRLFIFISVADDTLVFHQPRQRASNSEFEQYEAAEIRPPLSTGDHVTLTETDAHHQSNRAPDSTGHQTVFRAVAPGPMIGQRYGPTAEGVTPLISDNRYQGVWVTTNTGYQMEVSLPLPEVGTVLDIRITDYDSPEAYLKDHLRYRGDTGTRRLVPVEAQKALTYPSPSLSQQLDNLVSAGSQLRVFDRFGYLIAEANRLYDDTPESQWDNHADSNLVNAVLYRFFEWMLNAENKRVVNAWQLESTHKLNVVPDTSSLGGVRRYINLEADTVVGSLQPIVVNGVSQGYLLLETRDDVDTAFASTAMIRIFMLVTMASVVITAMLLLYASWLSYRIRDVTQQARQSVNADGRVRQQIKPSRQRDEIGELSRSLSRLVDRSSSYMQYLESLASRLTHEFRTPLSVIRTSLEHLDSDTLDAHQQQLVKRASGGADHLSSLIRSMNEATRLEQIIQQNERVWFEPLAWLENAVAGYSAVYDTRQISLTFLDDDFSAIDKRTQRWYAMPDTLQQALDKLIANAVDFGIQQYPIEITVMMRMGTAVIEVRNVTTVDALSDSLLHQQPTTLFEPLQSHRNSTQGHSTDKNAHMTGHATGHVTGNMTGHLVSAHLGLGLYIVKLVSEAHDGQPIARIEPETGLPNDLTSVVFGFTVQID